MAADTQSTQKCPSTYRAVSSSYQEPEDWSDKRGLQLSQARGRVMSFPAFSLGLVLGIATDWELVFANPSRSWICSKGQ
jgi:hypothetical protein